MCLSACVFVCNGQCTCICIDRQSREMERVGRDDIENKGIQGERKVRSGTGKARGGGGGRKRKAGRKIESDSMNARARAFIH